MRLQWGVAIKRGSVAPTKPLQCDVHVTDTGDYVQADTGKEVPDTTPRASWPAMGAWKS